MNKTKLSTFVLRLVCVLAIAAMALCIVGCNKKVDKPETEMPTSVTEVEKVGFGNTTFDFEVADGEGNVTKFKVATDKTTVGEALQDAGLIEGDEGEFGLYVKKVNGIEADYEKTHTYWAFYINGEMAMTGVDSTDIVDGDRYAFRVEK